MKFEKLRLSDQLLKSLSILGFHKTTDIQYKAIRAALTGSDILAVAQTGSGKTAAYLIPVIHKLIISKGLISGKSPKVLVLVPTRELSIQIAKVASDLCQFTDLQVCAIYGGDDADIQIQQLRMGVDIIICTPGRMFDLRSQRLLDLSDIHTLIIDEADQMLKLGFYKDVKDALRYIPKDRQTLFFSATIDQEIKKLANSLTINPVRIELSPKNPISKNISHCYLNVTMDDKRFFLERLVKENLDTKIIVFVRTKVRAERVQAAMQRAGIESQLIHGGLDQADRIKAIDSLHTGTSLVLIATDVTARGIDIPNVDIVVNYDVPEVPENYVHRIGRTGRGVAKGMAYTFVSKDEEVLLSHIEEYINYKIPCVDLDNNTYTEVKKIADPHQISMSDIENMVAEIDKEFDSWNKSRRKTKKK